MVKMEIKNFIEDALGIKNPSKEAMISTLNKHKHDLTCVGKHFMSEAIDRGLYNEIFYFLFFDESDLYSEEHKLDFNAVTKTYNPVTEQYEYMTVLDYIEQVALNSRQTPGSTRELKEMREAIIDLFDAKRYTELTAPDLEGTDFPVYAQSVTDQARVLCLHDELPDGYVALARTRSQACPSDGEYGMDDEGNTAFLIEPMTHSTAAPQ